MDCFPWVSLLLPLLLLQAPGGEGLQSVWTVRVDQTLGNSYNIFPNYMFKDSFVTVSIYCYARKETPIEVSWTLRQVHCMEQMYMANLGEDIDINQLERQARNEEEKTNPKSRKKMLPDNADQNSTTHQPVSLEQMQVYLPHHNHSAPNGSVLSQPPTAFQMSWGKRYNCLDHNIIKLDDESALPYRQVTFPEMATEPKVDTVQRPPDNGKKIKGRVVSAWETGMYHFELAVIPLNPNDTFQSEITVEMHGDYGYLSPIDWPLLPYNAMMSFLYLALSTIWIMSWARSHRFTLKIHVGMGFVAVAGAMCHTLVFVQNATENSRGNGVAFLMWFAQVLAVAQITFLNFILMVVSTGYGINIPTLPVGRLVAMGIVCGLQFVVGVMWIVCTDTALQIQYSYPILTKATLWMKVAIFVVMAAWIMISAIRTLGHLRQRHHAGTKMVTFTIFMISCILAFLIHIAVFGLSIGWMQACRTNWQLQWVFNSISHMEAFVLLIVLMVLWRPVDTAQSYAFAPLGMEALDSDSENDDSEDDIYSKETDKLKLDEI